MLSLIFIILFLIITPLIILYAAGYKLDKNRFTLERTGMLIIDSRPKGAKILLDGRAQKSLVGFLFNRNNFIATPAKIKNLLPGEYEVTLQLNGYFNWQKKIVVRPSASISIKNIYLLKNSRPVPLALSKIQMISFSPDKSQVLFLSDGQLNLLNLKTDEIKRAAAPANLKTKNIRWSANNRKLMIDNYLYNTGNIGSKVDLNKLTPGSFNYKWVDNILFYQDKASIYRLNEKNSPEKIIDDVKFSDYLAKDGYLYLINQSKQIAELQTIDLATDKVIKTTALPGPAEYSFINPEQILLNVYDNIHETLRLFDPSPAYNLPLKEIINNIKTTSWVDENNLLYTNNFEIWLDNLQSGQKTLVTRIGNAINNAIMHPTKDYIIYSTAQTFNAIELSGDGKTNTTKLTETASINSFALSADGGTIYFTGKVNNLAGLYKLSIQ
jgi:hypothetical protein